MAGNRVANFGEDFGDGNELVGCIVELFPTFNDGVGVHYGHRYSLGRFAAFDEYLAGRRGLALRLRPWWLAL